MNLVDANRMLSGNLTPVTKLKVLLKMYKDHKNIYTAYYSSFVWVGEKDVRQRVSTPTLDRIFNEK